MEGGPPVVAEAQMLLAVASGRVTDLRSALEAAGDDAVRVATTAMPHVLMRIRKRKRGAEKLLKTVAPHLRHYTVHAQARKVASAGDVASLALLLDTCDIDATRLWHDLDPSTCSDEVRCLFADHGVDVDTVSREQARKLGAKVLNAANYGEAERVATLLSHGASAEKCDNWNYRPLHRAMQKGHTDVVRALVTGGADVNRRDPWGYAPLHRAAQKAQIEEAHMLIAAGARLEAVDGRTNVYTPLSTACYHSDVEMSCLLVRCGAQVTDAILHNWNRGRAVAPQPVVAAVMLRDRYALGSHRACALASLLQGANDAVQTVRNKRVPGAPSSDGEDYAGKHAQRRDRAYEREARRYEREMYYRSRYDYDGYSSEDGFW